MSWSTPRRGARLGKTELRARAASARGGVLRLRLEGERMVLGGRALVSVRGALATSHA